jgi:phosphate transport system substrate-binding protein
MLRTNSVLILVLASFMGACNSESKTKIRVQGSTTVNPIMAQVSEILRKKLKIKITVDTQGGSAAGIFTAGEGRADIGMSSKPLTAKDKKKFPQLIAHTIGYDAVALVVSSAIYDGGVRSLSRSQIAAIFTGKVTNWRELGGPDAAIFVYNKEPGRGTRAVFDQYVFRKKSVELPSLKNYAEVGGNEESRQKIASHGAAVGQLSATWAENGKGLKIIGLKDEKGQIILPTSKNLRDRSYPMFRSLYLLTNGEARGAVAHILNFTLSKEGQKIVRKMGYLPVKDDA